MARRAWPVRRGLSESCRRACPSVSIGVYEGQIRGEVITTRGGGFGWFVVRGFGVSGFWGGSRRLRGLLASRRFWGFRGFSAFQRLLFFRGLTPGYRGVASLRYAPRRFAQ